MLVKYKSNIKGGKLVDYGPDSSVSFFYLDKEQNKLVVEICHSSLIEELDDNHELASYIANKTDLIKLPNVIVLKNKEYELIRNIQQIKRNNKEFTQKHLFYRIKDGNTKLFILSPSLKPLEEIENKLLNKIFKFLNIETNESAEKT